MGDCTTAKWMGAVVPSAVQVAGSPSNTIAWTEAYHPTKWHLDHSSHLATTDMGRKFEAVPLWGRAGSLSNRM